MNNRLRTFLKLEGRTTNPKHLVNLDNLTHAQLTELFKTFPSANLHLVAVQVLDDGDVLCLDDEQNPTGQGTVNGHYGPYVLTRAGKIMDVNHYYASIHAVDVPYKP